MAVFNEIDYRLSVVKRWGVISTLKEQSTAEHSFNVILMSERIARNWFGIKDSAKLYDVMRRAMNHDWWEGVTGDPPSYMKPYMDTTTITSLLSDDMTEDMDLGDDPIPRIVVKIADYLDAIVFLRMEISHGNKSVVYHLRDIEQRFKNYLVETMGDITPLSHDGTPNVAYIWSLYEIEIVDGLFNSNGQFSSELIGWNK